MIDPTDTLMNARKELENILELHGFEVTGAGLGVGQFDIWYKAHGGEFRMSVNPIILQDNTEASNEHHG